MTYAAAAVGGTNLDDQKSFLENPKKFLKLWRHPCVAFMDKTLMCAVNNGQRNKKRMMWTIKYYLNDCVHKIPWNESQWWIAEFMNKIKKTKIKSS